MTADLDTLLTALYVLADDFLPRRPRARKNPQITDAELVCLAVAQILLDCPSERRYVEGVQRADDHVGAHYRTLTHRGTATLFSPPSGGVENRRSVST